MNQKKLKHLWLRLFTLVSVYTYSQTVTIKGEAKHYKYKEISAWINKDFISSIQRQLTFTTIDSVGDFLLEFNLKEIQYLTLKIGKDITTMYVEPNTNYEVKISPPDSTTYQNPNIEHSVKIAINLKSKSEINALTIDYDKRFEDFLSKDYLDFVRRTPQAKIDSFKMASLEYYSTVSNSFFRNYIIYSIASIEEKTKTNIKKNFYQYIKTKPILYNHPEYMNFFNSFYKQKLQSFALSKQGVPLSYQINDRGSYAGTMEILKRDIYLINDTLRELVLLKGLYESYFDNCFKKKSIIAILQQLIAESKVVEHQKIAINILQSFSSLQVGALAPAFQLPDKTGLTHSLDELHNKKFVYLMFYDRSCTSCLQQLKVIPALKKQYGERIAFVSISGDKTNEELAKFCNQNAKFDWTLLHDATNEETKAKYEVKSLPAYFLINPEGKFIQLPAESPEGDIERAFFDITKPKRKTWNVGDKKDPKN